MENDRLLHQQLLVSRYMINHDRLLVYHSLGSGKTYTALASARYNPQIKPIVITYPSLVMKNFLNEYEEFKRLFPNTFPMLRNITLIKLTKQKREIILDTLRNSFIILDEAHLIRNVKNNNMYMTLCNVLDELWTNGNIKIMLLTGTPITDSVNDFFNLMRLMSVPKNQEEDYISILHFEFCQIIYVGFTVEGLDWSIVTLEMNKEQEIEYLESLEIPNQSFYSSTVDYVLSTHMKQDEALAIIGESYYTTEDTKFFIYCNRLKKDGTDYLEKKVEEIFRVKPCVITGESKNTSKDIIEKRIIIGSLAANEGINIMNVSQVHIITPHWNITQIQQAIGRGTRFRTDGKQPKLKVYCYAVYRDRLEPKIEYSIDLYKYKKSFEKDRENKALLDNFKKLIPNGPECYSIESEEVVEDLLENLVIDNYVKIENSKNIEKLLDLCYFKDIHAKAVENEVYIVQTEKDIDIPQTIFSSHNDNDWKTEIFKIIYEMSYDDMLNTLELSYISGDFQTAYFFKNNIYAKDNNVYHTFLYRRPGARSYGNAYFLTKPSGLTKKLRYTALGNIEWILCSTDEENKIWPTMKKRFNTMDNTIDMFFSLSEKKFKLKIMYVDKNNQQVVNRGRNIYSFSFSQLQEIFRYLIKYQLFYIANDEPMKKKDLISTIIWMFYNSETLKFF